MTDFKETISRRYKLTNLDPVSRAVGIDVIRDRPNSAITISQGGYIREGLKRYGFKECRGVPTLVEGKVKLLETETETKAPQPESIESVLSRIGAKLRNNQETSEGSSTE